VSRKQRAGQCSTNSLHRKLCVRVCRPATPRVSSKKAGKVRSDTPALSRPILYLPKELAGLATLLTAVLLVFYAFHCIWVSAEMYSAPSIVLQTRNPDGSKRTLDDFREAYAWLRCVLGCQTCLHGA
jgi:hypothetical protein